MKALSVRQPYAHEIMTGEKTDEFRSRRTNYRGPLLVCSSKTAEPEATADMPRGVAVCIVDVVGCRETRDGGFAWELANPRRVRHVPVKGSLGFFEVDAASVEVLP